MSDTVRISFTVKGDPKTRQLELPAAHAALLSAGREIMLNDELLRLVRVEPQITSMKTSGGWQRGIVSLKLEFEEVAPMTE